MTELENRTPSLLTIMPWVGVPGFPQDTAVRDRDRVHRGVTLPEGAEAGAQGASERQGEGGHRVAGPMLLPMEIIYVSLYDSHHHFICYTFTFRTL